MNSCKTDDTGGFVCRAASIHNRRASHTSTTERSDPPIGFHEVYTFFITYINFHAQYIINESRGEGGEVRDWQGVK